MHLMTLFGLAIGLVFQAGQEPSPLSPREQYEALVEQHAAPRGSYFNDLPRAETATKPFLELAREAADDPVAVEALHWVVTHTLFTPMAAEAMDLLERNHLRSEKLGEILRDLDRLYGGPFEPLEQLLRAAIQDSPHREVRAWACLTLARDLKAQKDEAERNAFLHPLFFERQDVPFYPAPTLMAADLEQREEEAAALYERLIFEFGDFAELAVAAMGDLYDLRNLSPGDEAPEIEGEDVDGNRFRLSDFRGKVVVLNFWNHTGCAPCRASYPSLRSLVEKNKDKPFALLGINNNDEQEVLKGLKDEGEITWQFWCDGNIKTGPIARGWNVSGWPTYYILDSRGVIRHKKFVPVGGTLEAAVDMLLEEIEETAETTSSAAP
jgi:peroxiredoxin